MRCGALSSAVKTVEQTLYIVDRLRSEERDGEVHFYLHESRLGC